MSSLHSGPRGLRLIAVVLPLAAFLALGLWLRKKRIERDRTELVPG